MDTRKFDCFYTKEFAVKECMDFLNKNLSGKKKPTLWVDPSAGEGIFLSHFPKPRVGLEIRSSSNEEIIKSDFLSWTPNGNLRDVITVGNPPFGRGASLAVRFFNHSALFSERIAMILPRSFQKESMLKRIHPNMYLEEELVLNPDSFTFNERNFAVNCVFQIWKKRIESRPFIKREITHRDFEFVKREEADFAIQRVGIYAGRVKFRISDLSLSSHYFLKLKNPQALKTLKSLDYSEPKSKTVGCPSLAKYEIVQLYCRETSE